MRDYAFIEINKARTCSNIIPDTNKFLGGVGTPRQGQTISLIGRTSGHVNGVMNGVEELFYSRRFPRHMFAEMTASGERTKTMLRGRDSGAVVYTYDGHTGVYGAVGLGYGGGCAADGSIEVSFITPLLTILKEAEECGLCQELL